MKKLLHVDSSVLGPHSVSRQVSAAIVDRLRQTVPNLEVTYRDLTSTPLSHLSGAHLAAAQGAAGADAGLAQEMAAGQAVLEEVANDAFLADVRAKGDRIRSRLEQFVGNYPELFDSVRGRGLMIGIKLKVEPRPFMEHLRENHQLLTAAAGDSTLRLLPPLVIGDAEIDEFFTRLSAGAADFPRPEQA